MKRIIAITMAFFGLSACAAAPGFWIQSPPGVSQQQQDADWELCQLKAAQPSGSGGYVSTQRAQQQYAVQCMRSQGYAVEYPK